MKFSEAMLKGFEKTEGRQMRHSYFPPSQSADAPSRVCVMGAVGLGSRGTALPTWANNRDGDRFARAWGISPTYLNDQGMPWEHIYGMARAAGL